MRPQGAGFFGGLEVIHRGFLDGFFVEDLNRDGFPDFLTYGGNWLGPGLDFIPGGPLSEVRGTFHRGDANDDGELGLSDAVYILT
jgi:hypothetical protein